MTLILGCATRNYVYQVSDRRISVPIKISGGLVYQPLEHDRNKGIFCQGRFAFAYSGDAFMGSTNANTDVLLANLLASFSDATRAGMDFVEWLTQAIRNVTPDTRFALTGLGWVDTPDKRRCCSEIVVTNSIDAYSGRWGAPTAYMRGWSNLRNTDVSVHFAVPVGASIARDLWGRTKTLIRRAAAEDARPETILEHLASAIREVAQQSSTVSEDVLVMVIPKPKDKEYRDMCIPRDGTPPRFDRPVCYLHPSQLSDATWHGPIFVRNGWVLQLTTGPFGLGPGRLGVGARTWKTGEGIAGVFLEDQNKRISVYMQPHDTKRQEVVTRILPGAHGVAGIFGFDGDVYQMKPLPGIDYLSDRTGYVVSIECANCKQARNFRPAELMQMFAPNELFVRISECYRCLLCGKEGHAKVVAYEEPPQLG